MLLTLASELLETDRLLAIIAHDRQSQLAQALSQGCP